MTSAQFSHLVVSTSLRRHELTLLPVRSCVLLPAFSHFIIQDQCEIGIISSSYR